MFQNENKQILKVKLKNTVICFLLMVTYDVLIITYKISTQKYYFH